MGAETVVRKMTRTDLPRVNEIDRLLFGEARLPTWPFSFEAYWAEYRPDISLVAEVSGTVAGFIVGTIVVEEHSYSVLNLRHAANRPPRYSQVAWIDMVGVHPDSQRAGTGHRLLEAFCAECKAIDVAVKGIAGEHDARLRHFLEAAGFKAEELVIYEKKP